MNLANQNGMASNKSCDLSIRQCKKKSEFTLWGYKKANADYRSNSKLAFPNVSIIASK
jgi:hypothetical protein